MLTLVKFFWYVRGVTSFGAFGSFIYLLYLLFSEQRYLLLRNLEEYPYLGIVVFILIFFMFFILFYCINKMFKSSLSILLNLIVQIITMNSGLIALITAFLQKCNYYGIHYKTNFFCITKVFTLQEKESWVINLKMNELKSFSLSMQTKLFENLELDKITNYNDFIFIIKDRVKSLNTLNNLELIQNAGNNTFIQNAGNIFSTVLTNVSNFCCSHPYLVLATITASSVCFYVFKRNIAETISVLQKGFEGLIEQSKLIGTNASLTNELSAQVSNLAQAMARQNICIKDITKDLASCNQKLVVCMDFINKHKLTNNLISKLQNDLADLTYAFVKQGGFISQT